MTIPAYFSDAFAELLGQVESYECDPGAFGMPVEDEDHPWHETVLKARKALEMVEYADSPTVTVTVEGGVVVGVTGLPDGYDYVVNDRDNQEG